MRGFGGGDAAAILEVFSKNTYLQAYFWTTFLLKTAFYMEVC